MSVRPSVRPSRLRPPVRPSVLRYQFETWYIHSVGGTTCRVWVESQLGHFDLVYSQKYVKLIFLQSWPQKSRWIIQIWYIGFKFRFMLKYIFWNFGDYFYGFWIFRSFPGFFSTCFEISIWNFVYTCSRWSYTSSSSFIPIGTLWPYFTAKNRSKSFICIHGLKSHIEGSDLVHTLILWVSWSLLIFVMVG